MHNKKGSQNIDWFFRLSSSLLCIACFDGNFKKLSSGWEKLLGYSIDELRSKSFIEFVHPDDVQATRAEAIHLTESGRETLTFVNRYRCRNGSYRWLQWNVMPDKEKALMYCVAHDITALRQSEEQYRILAEHTAEGVVVIRQGRVQYANALFVEMIGIPSVDTLVGKEVADLFPVKARDSFFEMCFDIEKGQLRRRTYQGQLISEQGRPFWVEGHLSFVSWFEAPSIIATLRDVDESKQRELSIEKEAELLRSEYSKLKSTLKDRFRFGTIIGKSQAMQEIYEQITEAGAVDSPVVIMGETGTGKEEVARMIHNTSCRMHNGFVPVNCGAIPDSLFESEFFGYKKGAFTGAFTDKHGFFDLAHQGTLFLDEVGELNLNLQVKLLRALEGGEYSPVGCNTAKHSDVRIISATNVDMMNKVRIKQIREDFYYRIHVIPIFLPPLRDRKEDIPLLAEYFLKKYKGGMQDRTFSGKEMDMLCDYVWPGNIRELQNVVQRYKLSRNLDFIRGGIPKKEADFNDGGQENDISDFREAILKQERRIIIAALEKNHWHKEKTASMLGLPKRTFFRKIQKLGLKEA